MALPEGLSRPITIISLAIAATVYSGGNAAAEERLLATAAAATLSSQQALEKEFWRCDYAVATRGPAATDREACVANYEALKQAKFSGNFAALQSWWQQNKAAEHAALAREAGR